VLSLTPGIDEAWERAGVLPELVSRLSVFPLRLPPLRERREDIRALAEHFLRKVARRNARAATALSEEAIAKLAAYTWPGNTRELENVVERAAILSRGDVILPEHLAFTARAQPAEPPARAPRAAAPAEPEADPAGREPAAPACARPRLDLSSQLDDIERRELLAALERCGGNKAEVARQFGMQRTTLYYRLKRLGIEG
jgi:two-component system, NtrC family, response regulator AtoC